jgi:Ca2+-binding EF-hand superfamily protein
LLSDKTKRGKDAAAKFMSKYDADNSGTIEFMEFVRVVPAYISASAEDVEAAFRFIDA